MNLFASASASASASAASATAAWEQSAEVNPNETWNLQEMKNKQSSSVILFPSGANRQKFFLQTLSKTTHSRIRGHRPIVLIFFIVREVSYDWCKFENDKNQRIIL